MLQLVGLVSVGHAERVEILGAADLELGDTVALLDLDALRVLPTSGKEELLDVVDLLRLRAERGDSETAQVGGNLTDQPHHL